MTHGHGTVGEMGDMMQIFGEIAEIFKLLYSPSQLPYTHSTLKDLQQVVPAVNAKTETLLLVIKTQLKPGVAFAEVPR